MSTIPTMDWLVVRGRAALEQYRRTYLGAEHPLIGAGELCLVTREDFERFSAICLEYVLHAKAIYILNFDGSIIALLCRHQIQSPGAPR